MPFELRPYQAPLVDKAEAVMLGGGVPAVVAPTGAGKTVLLAEAARRAVDRREQIVAVCHRAEIAEQLINSLRGHLDQQVGIEVVMAGSRGRMQSQVIVAMVPTLCRRLAHVAHLHGCTLLQDECFPAGTMVSGRPIETLRPGDLVEAFDHATGRVVWRPVMRLFRNPMTKALIRLTFSNGTSLICTPSHPIWADDAYIPAWAIRAGAKVVLSTMLEQPHIPDRLCNVRGASPQPDQEPTGEGETAGMDLLRAGVQQPLQPLELIANDGCHKPGPCLPAHDRAQPDEQGRRASESVNQAQSNGLETSCAGRQWKTAQRPPVAACFGAWLGVRTSRQDGPLEPRRKRVSPLLQTGHREPSADARHRGRWGESLLDGAPNAGQEERSETENAWVESAEVLKSTSDGITRYVPGKSAYRYVYNIEVNEHHNYFANGILVHNCHHAGSKSWGMVTEALQPRLRMGFTATPIRPNGKGLGDEGGFTELVIGPDPGELMDVGALCRYRMFATPKEVDITGLRKLSTGDYSISDLEDRVREINGEIVRDWHRLNPEGKRTIFVGVSVEHAWAAAEMFRRAGVSAAAVDGRSSKADRARVFADFRSGALRVLCACAVIDEGLDVPEATVLQITRPTASIRLYRQLCGRVLRPAPRKEHAIIIDHTSNWRELAPPDAAIEWSLHQECVEKDKRVKTKNPESGEVTLLAPAVVVPPEIIENGAELVDVTDQVLRQARPTLAIKILNDRLCEHLDLVEQGQAERDELTPWMERTQFLDNELIIKLGRVINAAPGWAEGQCMLNMITSKPQQIAAVKKLQQMGVGRLC